jgi:hypothetical protein
MYPKRSLKTCYFNQCTENPCPATREDGSIAHEHQSREGESSRQQDGAGQGGEARVFETCL